MATRSMATRSMATLDSRQVSTSTCSSRSPTGTGPSRYEQGFGELRREALRRHIEGLVEQGDLGAAAACEAYVAASPLDEHAWCLLVRVLAAAGRRPEALRACERARRILVEELGATPGPELSHGVEPPSTVPRSGWRRSAPQRRGSCTHRWSGIGRLVAPPRRHTETPRVLGSSTPTRQRSSTAVSGRSSPFTRGPPLRSALSSTAPGRCRRWGSLLSPGPRRHTPVRVTVGPLDQLEIFLAAFDRALRDAGTTPPARSLEMNACE